MKFTTGLQSDSSLRNQAPGSWRNGRNLVVGLKPGSLTNEPGFVELLVDYNLLPIGKISLGDGRTMLFSLGTIPEIGILTELSYVTIIKDAILNFSLDHPITGEYQRTIKGEEVISWTDNYNPPRLLNISRLGFKLNGDKSLVNPNEFAVSQLFAPGLIPDYELDSVSSGGQLPAGTYSFAICYEDQSGFTTKWLPTSRYVQISDDSITEDYTQVDGAVAGTITNKAISMKLLNLDMRYAYVRIAAIKRVNQVLTAYQFQRVAITTDSLLFTHTGSETKVTLTPDEVLVPVPEYKTVRTMTQLNDELFLGGVKVATPIDYQKYANNIRINWVDSPLDLKASSSSFKNSKTTFYFRPFLHGEVYAFYLVFHLKNGTLSDAYHIPGRAPLLGELANSPYVDDSQLGTNVLVFQTRDTSSKSNAETNMSFWQNANEFYPDEDSSDVFDASGLVKTLRNQPVRHHKFPTLQKHSSGYPNSTTGVTNVLGIQLSNVYIPDAIKDQVSHYEVFYAKRTLGNASIVGQSLSMFNSYFMTARDLSTVPSDLNTVSSTGGNWSYYFNEASTPDKYSILRGDSIRLHPPDILLNKTALTPTHITNEVLLARTAKIRRPLEDKEKPSLLIELNYLDTSDETFRYTVSDQYYLQRITSPQLVSLNTDPPGNINNVGCSTAFVAMLPNANAFSGVFDNGGTAGGLGYVADFIWTDYEEDNEDYDTDRDTKFFTTTPPYQHNDADNQFGGRFIPNYLTNLHIYRTDMYNAYRSQELVATGFRTSSTLTTSAKLFGGDTFVSNYGYRVTAPSAKTVLPVGEYSLDPNVGIKVLYHYFVESSMNLGLRMVDNSGLAAANQTIYYPKVGNSYLDDYLDLPLTQTLEIGYNQDYTNGDDLNKSYPLVPNLYIGEFLTRVHRSLKSSREELTSSWKNFLANSYYEMPRNRGVITNLAALGSRLLIHHERALYRTVSKTELNTSEATLTIGSGDLFAIEPEELVYGESGYAGTVFQHACLVTRVGYFFPSQNGKLFLLADKLEDITKYNEQLGFELLLNKSYDNPYAGNGISSVFDEQYERLLISFIQGDKLLTLSYSPQVQNLVSTHDYASPLYTDSGNQLLSIKDTRVYKHHVGTPGNYYTDAINPFSVDVVSTTGQAASTINVYWAAELTKNNVLLPTTLTSLLAYSDRQCSGYQVIELPKRGRFLEDTSYFNDLRDLVLNKTLPFMSESILNSEVLDSNVNYQKPWFQRGRFVGSHIVVRASYDNLTGGLLSLHEVSVNQKPSNRV